MLIGLFLLYLAAFIAVLFAIQWLVGFFAIVTATGSVEWIVAAGAMAAIAVLARYNQGGIVVTVAIGVFWSLLLFGAESATLTPTLILAAALLYAAAALVLMEAFMRGRTS